MSTVSLTVKPIAGDGTTDYIDGNYLPAAELQADFDAIVNVINGNLDESNLHSSTQIPNTKLAEIAVTKVSDYSDDLATSLLTSSPGDSSSASLATDLKDELRRLRYRIGANKGYLTSAVYMNASAAVTSAGWVEPAIVGRNLLPNPGFELQSGAANSAPDGWTLYSTPSTVAIENPAFTGMGLEKRSLNIVTDGANEGIYTTIGGLKASTKYLVGMAYTITDNGTVAGTVGLYTANGLASGAYQNLAVTSSTEAASTVQYVNGIVKSTSTPDTMTIRIYATTAGADFNIISAWMYELSDGFPDELPAIPSQVATDITASTFPTTWTGSASAWRTDTLSSLSLTQYIPAQGYRAIYEVTVPYADIDAADSREGCRVYGAILLTIDGGSTNVVSGPICQEVRGEPGGNDTLVANTIRMSHIVDNPTAGSSYVFAFRLGVWDGSDFEQVSVPPVVGSLQMEARATLRLERM